MKPAARGSEWAYCIGRSPGREFVYAAEYAAWHVLELLQSGFALETIPGSPFTLRLTKNDSVVTWTKKEVA